MPRRLPLGAPARLAASGLRGVALARPRLTAALALLAVALPVAWLWLRDSSLARVERVTVVGATGPRGPQVRARLVAAARTMSTLHVRRARLLDAVRADPTVADVLVDASPPHAVRLTVVARPAVAAVPVAGQLVGVAADGTLLRGVPAPADVPRLPAVGPTAAATLTAPPAVRALRVAVAAGPRLGPRLADVRLGGRGLQADLRGGPSVYVGDDARLAAKWVAAGRILGDPGARGARYLDVRLPERAVAGGLAVASASPSSRG